MILPVMVVVFIMGFQSCQSRKCFECELRRLDGEVTRGTTDCDKVNKSTDHDSPLLRECPESKDQCYFDKTKGKYEGKMVYELHRGCTSGRQLGCHKIDKPPYKGVNECVCKKDACNTNDFKEKSTNTALVTSPQTALLLVMLLTSSKLFLRF